MVRMFSLHLKLVMHAEFQCLLPYTIIYDERILAREIKKSVVVTGRVKEQVQYMVKKLLAVRIQK